MYIHVYVCVYLSFNICVYLYVLKVKIKEMNSQSEIVALSIDTIHDIQVFSYFLSHS